MKYFSSIVVCERAALRDFDNGHKTQHANGNNFFAAWNNAIVDTDRRTVGVNRYFSDGSGKNVVFRGCAAPEL
jgi:hypothetical protein